MTERLFNIKTENTQEDGGRRGKQHGLSFPCLLLAVLCMGCHLLCSCPLVTSSTLDQITNNKIFTHNRSTNTYESDTSFFTRLRDLTAKKTDKTPLNNKSKGAKGNNNKNKRNKMNPQRKPSYMNNPNHNYYMSSFNIPKTPLSGGQNNHGMIFTPTTTASTPTRLHPLTVLKTEMNSNKSSEMTYGRSNLHDIVDDQGRSSEIIGSSSPDTDFFKNFRDHAQDPIAQESRPPVSYGARPNSFNILSNTGTSGSGLVGSHSSSSRNPPAGLTTISYPTAAYNSIQNQSPNSGDYKNVNYWPHKLNSYYGDEFNLNYMNQIHHIKPLNSFNKSRHAAMEPETSSSSINTVKTSMIDRVSAFYTDYKIIAWIITVFVAGLAALFGLLILYWRNPPTEVVLARDLARTLTDPTLLIFISEALRKYGEINKSFGTISNRMRNNENIKLNSSNKKRRKRRRFN